MTVITTSRWLMGLLLAVTLSGTAAAQTVGALLAAAPPRPDAGSLQQQIDRERIPSLPPKAIPEAPAPAPAMKPPAGMTVTVTAFHFAGNTLLTSEQLAPAVTEFLNRPLDFAELQKAAAAVANAYREAGWVVRTYLPEQDIKDGVVTIQVVEAVFGGVRLEGGKPVRGDLSRVNAFIEAQQKPGEPVSSEALDRALLIAGDQPDVAVSGTLAEGTQNRTTDLLVKLTDKPMLTGEATLENNGSRSTGPERATGNFSLNSPFGFGEQISANVIHTMDSADATRDGSDYGRLALGLPIGLDGWRMGVNGSYLAYNLIAPQFTSLNANGTSATVGLETSYPLVRSKLHNLYVSGNIDHKTFDNRSLGAVTSHYDIDALTVGLSGNLFDNFGGGGANAASLSLAGGNLDLNGSPNQAADAATTRTNGTYGKLRYAISRQQSLTEDLSFFASLSGQRANKNLDSSEKFYLGGPDGVRAYPASEAGGAGANLVSLELRQHLTEGIILTGLFDYGRMTTNVNNAFAGGAAPNGYSLKGAGLSLAWQTELGPTFRAIWAHRIGDNPNPTATGQDQDGTLFKDRFWLSAAMSF